jgi:hypothetical protein
MLKNKLTYLLLALLPGLSLMAQTYGNEWIAYSQSYYKIKIAKEGLYILDSATLAASGVPVATLDPRNIQLFHKGQEIRAYIPGETDGVLNKSDYILFYADKNTGKDDSLYYDVVPYLTNPYYSIINDTAAVFLTWNSAGGNKRYLADTDTTFSQYSNSPYYFREVISGINAYSPGPLNPINMTDPRYKAGEGFFYQNIAQTNTSLINFSTAAVYTGGPPAVFTICYSGANDIAVVSPDHIIQAYYTDASGNQVPLVTDPLDAYAFRRSTYTVNPSVLGNMTTLACSSLVNTQTAIDNYTHINYLHAWLPHQFTLFGLSEEKMYLPDDGAQSKSKLAVSLFGGSKPILLNLSDGIFHTVATSGGSFQALVPNSGKTKLCYLADSTRLNQVSLLTPVNGTGKFVDYSPALADSNYLLVYNRRLNADSSITNYRNFRAGMQGGSYKVIAAEVQDLYDQFGYGVNISAMAIRNFCAWVIASPFKNPSQLFLVGKSIHPADCITAGSQADTVYYRLNLVPTWGNPPSDNLITQGLPGSAYLEPAIPTGRLAAQSGQEVSNYLSKVVLHSQQTAPELWKKHALHFIGGNTYYEQQALSYYMKQMENVYEDTLMGGHVFSFYKTTTAPTSVTTNDSVRQLIESGVSVMTFFGHGSQTGFDQNIDNPQNYNNSPRFPLILANSCYTGDIHSGDQQSHSEVYTLAPNNKGSIAYLANVSEGLASDLFLYSNEFYRHLASKTYGQSYGACVKKAVNQLMYDKALGAYPGDTILDWTCLAMTFHGDPAVGHYTFPKPDYTLANSDVIFKTNAYPDSIGVSIVMTNLAKAVNDSFTVLLQRNFPNGDTVKFFRRSKAPFYTDTLSFNIPKDYYRAVGINCFEVNLDFFKEVDEVNELNNATTGGVCLFIPGSAIEPVWPYKYAIVPDISKVTLKASTADPFAQLTTYRFQVDTNDKFLTPLVNTTVNAPGGVVSLPVSLYGQDSMVYFWRVCKDDNDTLNWKESSFQVITGKYGWGQSHFHQFKNDNYQYVLYVDSVPRRFEFVNDVKSYKANTVFLQGNITDANLAFNNAVVRWFSCAPNGWTIAVMDQQTGNFKYSDTLGPKPPAYWLSVSNNCVCDMGTRMARDFGKISACGHSTATWQSDLVNYITDSIKTGEYVMAYTVRWLNPVDSLNNGGLINAFHMLGSAKIDSLTDSTLLIIFGRKGMTPGMAHETLSYTKSQAISQSDSIVTNYKNGYIASEVIGPCMYADSAWKSLHWRYSSLATDFTISDSIVVRLIGITSTGQKVTLANFPKDSLDILNLAAYANGKQYPYLQLIAFEADNQYNTPPQLGRWQIIYDPAPEAAIHPPAGFTVTKSKVDEGEDYKVTVPIKNISDFAFTDSLLVTYELEDANRVMNAMPYRLKKKPFLPDSVIFDTITISTLGYPGANVLWLDVNPPGHARYQPEQYHFNNIAQIRFDVTRDKINPLLDVTFDGVHILNGDIVSAKPSILIGLKDENKFLALNDTSNFEVYLQWPGASTEKRLFFKDELQFTPALLPNNSCKINYKPLLPQDGKYTLRVVATDRTKNLSGAIDYKIQFEIVNKPSITEVLNYPNPFSTSTRFVFTVTGSEVPETFKIQIMTIAGRVVREITREELGFIHIGRNITEYAWDGTDQFGDRLANGVYLYRVDTRLNGQEIDHLTTEADGYFKKGFGKMLLMR